MRNLYLLEKKRGAYHPQLARILRVALNVTFRCVVVLGFIGLVGAPRSLECGAFTVWEWIVAELVSVVLIAGGWIGEIATHVDLPLDGGEEDECGFGEG